MTYRPTRYLDADLKLKPTIAPNKLENVYVRYAQLAGNDLGYSPALTDDGQFGPKTTRFVKAFQKACGLVVTGLMDQEFWMELDWRVYGAINGAWVHARVLKSNLSPGGPAIVAVEGLAYNELSGLPVNSLGMTREGQHGSDVSEAFLGRSLGYEGAVRRNQVGTGTGAAGNPSTHWNGAIAGDDMADQSKNGRYDNDELRLMKILADYLFLRAQLGDYHAAVMPYTHPYTHKLTNLDVTWRGRDRARTLVVGNVKMPTEYFKPTLTLRRDCSWSAKRNTWKSGTGTAHVSPLHLHSDFAPGAPYGSPF